MLLFLLLFNEKKHVFSSFSSMHVCSRALNDTKQVSREEIHPKDMLEDSMKVPSLEEKEDDDPIGIDFSLKNETVAICVIAADKSLLENTEAKNE